MCSRKILISKAGDAGNNATPMLQYDAAATWVREESIAIDILKVGYFLMNLVAIIEISSQNGCRKSLSANIHATAVAKAEPKTTQK